MSDISSAMGEAVDQLLALDVEGPAKDLFEQVMHGSALEGAPNQFEDGTSTVERVECNREVETDRAQKVGQKKRGGTQFYKCNDCNALASRMVRIMARKSQLAKDWAGLTPEMKKDFMARAHHLSREELEHGMETRVVMSKEQVSNVTTGANGDYLPLSMWASKGLSAAQLKALENNAPKIWNPVVNDHCYQFMIQSAGHSDSEITRNGIQYETGPDKRSQQHQPSTGSQSKKPKHDPAQKAIDAQRRKEEQEQKLKRKNEVTTASKLIAMIAPVLATGKSLMSGKIVQSASTASKIPAIVLDESRSVLNKLEFADMKWKDVLGGGPVPHAKELQANEIHELKKAASKAFTNLSSMLKLVE